MSESIEELDALIQIARAKQKAIRLALWKQLDKYEEIATFNGTTIRLPEIGWCP